MKQRCVSSELAKTFYNILASWTLQHCRLIKEGNLQNMPYITVDDISVIQQNYLLLGVVSVTLISQTGNDHLLDCVKYTRPTAVMWTSASFDVRHDMFVYSI